MQSPLHWVAEQFLAIAPSLYLGFQFVPHPMVESRGIIQFDQSNTWRLRTRKSALHNEVWCITQSKKASRFLKTTCPPVISPEHRSSMSMICSWSGIAESCSHGVRMASNSCLICLRRETALTTLVCSAGFCSSLA